MFFDISWQQYFLGVAAIAAVYYAMVLIRYYREDVFSLIRPREIQHDTASPSDSYPTILGTVRPEPGSSYVESSELEFPNSESESSPAPSDELMSEVGSLVTAFSDVNNKEEFLSLLGILISRHEPDVPGSERVREFLLKATERLPFSPSLSDLNEVLGDH